MYVFIIHSLILLLLGYIILSNANFSIYKYHECNTASVRGLNSARLTLRMCNQPL